MNAAYVKAQVSQMAHVIVMVHCQMKTLIVMATALLTQIAQAYVVVTQL